MAARSRTLTVTSTPRRLLRVGSLCAGLALSRGAAAQPADATRAGDAERLFREGRALMEAGDLAAACPRFAESERLDPAPGTLLSLADCEERGVKLVRAREHYQLAASGFARRDARRAFATGRAQALERRIAHLTLRLPAGAPDGTVVRLADSVVRGADLGAATAIDPGEARIVVSAPGRVDKAMSVILAEGETRDVLCELGPEPTAAPRAQPHLDGPSLDAPGVAAKPRGDARRTAGVVLMGVGAASLLVGGVSGVLAVGKASTVKEHCDGDYLCDQEGVDAASSGRLLAPLSTVTLIAGAGLVGVGAYLYFTRPGRAKSPTLGTLAVAPLLSADGAGLRVWRDF